MYALRMDNNTTAETTATTFAAFIGHKDGESLQFVAGTEVVVEGSDNLIGLTLVRTESGHRGWIVSGDLELH